jgi:hypothetical protein
MSKHCAADLHSEFFYLAKVILYIMAKSSKPACAISPVSENQNKMKNM